MRLYKFVASKDAVLNIVRGALKFTPINQLNDPSEFNATFNRQAVRDSLETLRMQGLTEEQFTWLQKQSVTLDLLAPEEKVIGAPRTIDEANRMLSMSVYQDFEYMEKKLFRTIRLIRERVGVLSLTSRYDSLPMWAHYANEGKGYVVAFDHLEQIFVGDESGSLNTPKEVQYCIEFVGMTFDPSTQDRLFLSKHSDWSYEREWRIITPLNSCKKSPQGSLFLRDVSPTVLCSVICGYNSELSDIEEIQNALISAASKASLVLASVKQGKLQFLPR